MADGQKKKEKNLLMDYINSVQIGEKLENIFLQEIIFN